MASPVPSNLTAVRGITVGHWTDVARATGCTVVLAPPGGMRAAGAVRGRATGTRELDALNPRHVVGHIDAILLTGGSAYGLGAADGVMRWLREHGRGYPVGSAGIVPIVPTAVIFDFDLAPGAKADRWPTAADAYQACEAAGSEIAEGAVGAGTGATVGKALGPRRAMKGGLGTAATHVGELVVGALVVVNAVGDVVDGSGRILAGARGPDGAFVDGLAYLAQGGAPFGAGRNTTLAVVATNAALDRVALESLAHAAGDALARRIIPYGTVFDGDIVFAVSTAVRAPATPLQVEALAALAVPEAVERAVRRARGIADIPGLADER
ncbi:MAG TPA: P1 family peptidase [Gemmatimonadales bacterium]|nr:P1 family peptidase [Gemmatimonadales bacterium]